MTHVIAERLVASIGLKKVAVTGSVVTIKSRRTARRDRRPIAECDRARGVAVILMDFVGRPV